MLQTRVKLFLGLGAFILFLVLILSNYDSKSSDSDSESEEDYNEDTDNAPQSVLDMFKDTGCTDYESLAKEYYKKIQNMFSSDVVNSIIKGEALPIEIVRQQAMVASELMNKYCGFNVDNEYPFCCSSPLPNSKFTSCNACNLLNNIVCDSIGKDDCHSSSTKFGIDYCKLDNDKCVYNKDTTYLISHSVECDNSNKGCIYSNKNKQYDMSVLK